MTRAKDNNNATILSIGISKGRIAYQKLIGSRHVKATVPTATSHWANSQTCCMQDERPCLPLIPSFDVPFEHKKGLKHVLVRLLWHGFTETHDHVSPFCLEYRHVAWCQVCDELKTCTTLYTGMCLWMAQGAQEVGTSGTGETAWNDRKAGNVSGATLAWQSEPVF